MITFVSSSKNLRLLCDLRKSCVKDSARVNEALAKNLGASAIICLNKYSVQVIVGARAEFIAQAMQRVFADSRVPSAVMTALPPPHRIQADIKKIQATPLILLSPITGTVHPLETIADKAYASKILGEGVAIYPTAKTIVAPIDGKITRIVHTNHAFYLTSSTGVEILIHIGIQLDKQYSHGFKRLVEEDSIVVAGQPILLLDLEYLNANGVSLLSPVLVQNLFHFGELSVLANGEVVAGQTDLFAINPAGTVSANYTLCL